MKSTDFTRNEDRSYSGTDKKGNPSTVPQKYSDELEDKLAEGLAITKAGQTILFLFEDMFEINEHFQAVLDWFKERGNGLRHRYGQGVFLQSGMVYFVGHDTFRETRGVAKAVDLQPEAEELVRESGLEARLREKGLTP